MPSTFHDTFKTFEDNITTRRHSEDFSSTLQASKLQLDELWNMGYIVKNHPARISYRWRAPGLCHSPSPDSRAGPSDPSFTYPPPPMLHFPVSLPHDAIKEKKRGAHRRAGCGGGPATVLRHLLNSTDTPKIQVQYLDWRNSWIRMSSYLGKYSSENTFCVRLRRLC